MPAIFTFNPNEIVPNNVILKKKKKLYKKGLQLKKMTTNRFRIDLGIVIFLPLQMYNFPKKMDKNLL